MDSEIPPPSQLTRQRAILGTPDTDESIIAAIAERTAKEVERRTAIDYKLNDITIAELTSEIKALQERIDSLR